jgi:lysophospholipase L1-like esterase
MFERPYGMDEPCEATPYEQRKGLRHLALVGAMIALFAAGTYGDPSLVSLRPWVPGEDVPIVRLFGDAPEGGASIAAAGGAGESGEGSVDETVLANLEDEVPPSREGPPGSGTGTEPVDPAQRRVHIDPSELEGLTVEIEDASGTAMRSFYESLHRTARGEAGAITRVAHFGDSSIALDGITQTLRQRFQHRFGDAGHGWVLAARGTMPYRHRDVRHDSSPSWTLMDITHLPLRDGRYGLGGYQARSWSGANARFGTAEDPSPVGRAVSRFEVFYQRHPRGGRFELRVDGGEPAIVDSEGETSDEVHEIEVADGPHRLEVRALGHGETRLYGVVMERSGPGVVYDSLGMVGARARRFLGFDVDHLRRQLDLRGTNLVVIGYGGNDADDERSEAEFEDDFRRVARLVREARPEASCILFAPLDQAERDERGRIATLPAVPRIVAAMRTAARAEGCAFFDTWRAMGGAGGMERWYRSEPRLASSDFRHATPAGYRVLGNMFYKALLSGFADHLGAS